MRLTLVWSLLLVVVGSCTQAAHERAEQQALQGTHVLETGDYKAAIALFDQALQVEDRQDAYVGRAKALAKLGDGIKAVESLGPCKSHDCESERTNLVEELKGQVDPSFSDAAGFQRFLRMEDLVGVSKACALVIALGSTDEGNDARRKLVRAAIQAEVDRLAGSLRDVDPRAPRMIYVRNSGVDAADATGCTGIDIAETRLTDGLEEITSPAVKPGAPVDLPRDKVQTAFDWAVLSAKLGVLKHSPTPTPSDPTAAMPLRSAADLKPYLNALTAAGNSPECALFSAILRAERLPRAQRAALKGPLSATLAPLAPKNGEQVEFKVGGRKTISMPSVASGAQSCRELDDIFVELSRGAAKIAEAMAAVGDDGSSGLNSVKLDRSAYIYEALRARLEHPMSKADVAAANEDYSRYQRTHRRSRAGGE